jgi:hypothetical protein
MTIHAASAKGRQESSTGALRRTLQRDKGLDARLPRAMSFNEWSIRTLLRSMFKRFVKMQSVHGNIDCCARPSGATLLIHMEEQLFLLTVVWEMEVSILVLRLTELALVSNKVNRVDHDAFRCMMTLKVRHARHAAGDKVIGNVRGKANHGQATVLQFLHTNVHLLLIAELVPLVSPIKHGRSFTNEGLAFVYFGPVLDTLEDNAKENELGPPLRISFQYRVDWVGGVHVRGVKGTDGLGPEPTHVGQHGGPAVGQFSPAQEIGRGPLRQTNGIELACRIKFFAMVQ